MQNASVLHDYIFLPSRLPNSSQSFAPFVSSWFKRCAAVRAKGLATTGRVDYTVRSMFSPNANDNAA